MKLFPLGQAAPFDSGNNAWLTWFAILGLLTLAALFARPPLVLDETRYLAVAWEMWQRGDFLVPFKNGAPYSHKPPLLFWLIQGGWSVFGPNDWWPRLLSPLLALANAWLTWRLARRFWPDTSSIARLAPLVLLSTLIWLVYAQALMFDMLIAACALLGLNALAEAARPGNRPVLWWGLFGLAVGLGLLAKGPAILAHLLPAALLAPWWGGIRHRARWYGSMLVALLSGVALALAWAIPAGIRGGEAYQHAIFWGQTAHRMVNSFAHQLPFWWYLATLPLFFFPWMAWPGLMRRLAETLRTDWKNPGLRFILTWLGSALLIFSAISGKQPHYILPETPALALLIAVALAKSNAPGRPLLPALGLIGLGLAFTWLGLKAGGTGWAGSLVPWSGAGFLLGGLALLSPRAPAATVGWMTAVMLGCMLWLLLAVFRPLSPAWDMGPMGRALARMEASGHPIAHDGKYHGQYHFAGRLTRPLEELHSPAETQAWIATHPDGALVMYFPKGVDVTPMEPVHVQLYRGSQVALIKSGQAAAALTRHAPPKEEDEP